MTAVARTASDAVDAVAPKPAVANATIADVAKPMRAAALKAKDEAVVALDSKLLKDSSFTARSVI